MIPSGRIVHPLLGTTFIQSSVRELRIRKTIKGRKELKGEIRRLLLNILVNENDYIETPILVQKIGLFLFCVLFVISLPPPNSICSVFDCNNCNNINFILKQL